MDLGLDDLEAAAMALGGGGALFTIGVFSASQVLAKYLVNTYRFKLLTSRVSSTTYSLGMCIPANLARVDMCLQENCLRVSSTSLIQISKNISIIKGHTLYWKSS